MKSWLFRLIASLAIVALSGCASLENQIRPPEVSLADVHVTDMSLSSAQLAFDVKVTNPNPLGISLHGLSYALSLQDKPLFNGTLGQSMRITANGTSNVTIPFTLRFEDVFGSLAALRNQREIHYKISGEADFGLIRLPYSKSGTIPLPQLPDVSVEHLRINKLGLSGAELALALKVKNNNAFPLRLNGLGYDLKLANTSLLRGESSTPLNVASNDSGDMVLTLRLDFAQLGELLKQLRDAPSMPIELDSRIKLPDNQNELPYHWKGSVPLLR